MKKLLYILSIVFVALFFAIPVSAQKPVVKVSIDTTRILIGDQVNILLQLEQNKNDQYQFPLLRDTIVTNVEILSLSQIDTQELDLGRVLLRQRILVTSFDTGFYVIPPFYFPNLEGFDSLRSKALPLEVLTLEIDTTKGIADIKLPYDVPLSFMEILPYLIVALLLIGIAIVIWYMIRKRKRKPVEEPVRVKPEEPAHLWALRNLDSLAKEKLWQKGKIKLYHSRLSEILRYYIEFRFDIKAMEQITSEIMSAFKQQSSLSDDQFDNLLQSLEQSDLVKFAKWHPMPDENERSMEIAYEFILKTKKTINLREPGEDLEIGKDIKQDTEQEEQNV